MKTAQKGPPIPIFLIFVVGIFLFSIYYLYDAVTAFFNGSANASFQLFLGLFGFATSFLALAQFLKRLTMTPPPVPKILTTVECKNDGFKNVRPFAKGDYVFKTVENCQKCNEPMMITAIYVEEPPKKS
ncbi:MAG: hypothetical protein QG670_1791 [Thermoproteota archaeon]|nr:hypothetical protein [Thermoproteota archaeon]